MRCRIRHETRYRYSAPVCLGRHVLRLRPRDDVWQRIFRFDLDVDPRPVQVVSCRDAVDNVVTHLWFSGSTHRLTVVSALEVETLRRRPIDDIGDSGLGPLPVRYPPALQLILAHYLVESPTLGAEVTRWASTLAAAARGDALHFLSALMREIPRIVRHEIRLEGEAHTAADTLASRRGACRDLAALFIQACRAQGLAARFVSGYHDRSSTPESDRHLHAWAEVFLPAYGWRGYDPTYACTAGEAHVALAAAPEQQGTMPVEGGYSFVGAELRSTLDFAIQFEAV